MADITPLFKATVKAVKARLKAQGEISHPDKSILGSAKQKSEFSIKAKNVVNTITQMRCFLLEHRKAYIDVTSYLGSEGSRMTDSERNQIEAEAETFMKTSSEAIKLFKLECNMQKVFPQVKGHRKAVFDLIQDYLKVVCKIYSEQRAIRVKRVIDRKRLARLEPEKKRRSDKTFVSQLKHTESGNKKTPHEKATPRDDTKQTVSLPHISDKDEEQEDFSPEELQLFEQENQQLLQEMNNMVDEVRQVEGKVVEIARLQEIIADKVLEQEPEIDHIAQVVVGTTENIKEGNEEIREAMKNNAGLRVWILFFLIVCSFSLLFLDWYNP